MAALRSGRTRRGWSISEAARRSGVSRPMISLLERGLRRPSQSTAQDLIEAYELTGQEARAVWAIGIPFVGRDSPFKTDWRPDSY